MTDVRPPVDFATWARHTHGSPLYRHLSERIADDPDLIALASALEHPARQNLFFAAVQYLMPDGDPLARFYASRVENPAPAEDAYPLFRAFALDHAEQILEIGRTRYTQTNEVRRVAALMPALVREADRLGEPVHLVEVGASAGLNLCLDRFAYDFGGLSFGHSEVTLSIQIENLLSVPGRAPYVQRRVGIDLHPIDVDDADDVRWLESLVWPEHTDRRRRLRAAIRVRRTVQVESVRGDGSIAVGGVLDRLPTSGPAIVFHCFTLNQFDADARRRFDDALHAASGRRSIARIGFEYWDGGDDWPQIKVGITEHEMVPFAVAHPHGEWIRGVP